MARGGIDLLAPEEKLKRDIRIMGKESIGMMQTLIDKDGITWFSDGTAVANYDLSRISVGEKGPQEPRFSATFIKEEQKIILAATRIMKSGAIVTVGAGFAAPDESAMARAVAYDNSPTPEDARADVVRLKSAGELLSLYVAEYEPGVQPLSPPAGSSGILERNIVTNRWYGTYTPQGAAAENPRRVSDSLIANVARSVHTVTTAIRTP